MISVVIATLGRSDLIIPLLQRLNHQSRVPDYVVISCTKDADLPMFLSECIDSLSFECVILYSEVGLPKQRNCAVKWLHKNVPVKAGAIVVFSDDDFVMRNNWLEVALAEFAKDSNIAGIDGIILADGVHAGGYNLDEAISIVMHGTKLLSAKDTRGHSGTMRSLYGCNMIARYSTLLLLASNNEDFFDEALPGYAWLEDWDFSIRLGKFGVLKRFETLAGVHMGSPLKRSSGIQTGYTQIANPIYLFRKGTMTYREMFNFVIKNIVINIVKSILHDPIVDRRGRLYGNLIAIRCLINKSLTPNNVPTR